MDWFSLLLPFGYVTILTLSLATFSQLYRRRKALQASKLESWFPEHTYRNIYLTLLEQQTSAKEGGGKTTKIPDSLLRAALLQRSTENIRRLVQLRSQKPALMTLQQRGSVGDDLVQRFNFAEKEMEAELRDCVQEANALCPPGQNGVPNQGWGQSLFQSAGEIVNQENLRKQINVLESQREKERIQWITRHKATREGFLKVIGADEKKAEERPDTAKTSDGSEDAVVVESPGAQTMERHGSVASSGDGSVAGDGPTTPGAGGGGGGGKKKKKNKKKN